jgi:hypothetical protein
VTPRTADGRPDLSGLWVSATLGRFASGQEEIVFPGRGGSFFGYEADGSLWRQAGGNTTIPRYRPEHWDRIIDNEYRGNWEDPVSSCIPLGVPRMGAPAQIVNVAGQPAIILFYQAGATGYGGSYQSADQVRWVWTDGRPHDPLQVAQESLNGDSVGRWEGDTLVIETIGFTDATWLHKNGYPHGFNMKVTERLTRVGNVLRWEATVEDPEYLLEPWTLTPVARLLNPDPAARLPEGLPCVEREPYASPARSG